MDNKTEVILIGAGPIGIEVAAGLKALSVPYLHFEAGRLGETIARWPASTPFFSSPERCAVAGVPIQSLHQSMLTGDEYLAYLRQVAEIRDLDIRFHEGVSSLRNEAEGFVVTSERHGAAATWRARNVILATGNMARPRGLGVPGEHLPHVHRQFLDVHRYFRQRVLVVGGRNSAVEAAIRCWRAGAEVTISYRREDFEKKKLNSRYHLEISILVSKGRIAFLPSTTVREIRPGRVILDGPGGSIEHPVDFVLIQVGYEADTSLLEEAGASLEGPEKTPLINPQTMESDVPGLFLAGTASGGGKAAYKVFVATSHDHAPKILRAITGKSPPYYGSLPQRRYDFDNADIVPTEGNSEEFSSPAEPLPGNISG